MQELREMTGFKSKKTAALDEDGMYLVHQTKSYADNSKSYADNLGKSIVALGKKTVKDIEQINAQPEQEALKLALEALKEIARHATTPWEDEWCGELANETLKAINALAQPEQEPVCPACKAGVLYECVACSSNNYPPQGVQEPWREFASDYERGVIDGRQKQMQSSVDKAVNAMTQRTWVGLSSVDFNDFNPLFTAEAAARWAEAKLKEKNNG